MGHSSPSSVLMCIVQKRERGTLTIDLTIDWRV